MTNAFVFDVPVELCLEFVTAIGKYPLDAKGECLDDIVDESNRILLGVTGMDFQRPNPRGIIDGGVLIPLQALSFFVREVQKLNVELDRMTRYLLRTAFGMDRPAPHLCRSTIESTTPEDAIDSGITDAKFVIALQTPDGPDGSHVLLSP